MQQPTPIARGAIATLLYDSAQCIQRGDRTAGLQKQLGMAQHLLRAAGDYNAAHVVSTIALQLLTPAAATRRFSAAGARWVRAALPSLSIDRAADALRDVARTLPKADDSDSAGVGGDSFVRR